MAAIGVALVSNEREWHQAGCRHLPQPALQQAVVDGAGQDLRVYVVHGRIVAAVMRTAAQGVVSNFKRGGSVALRGLTPQGARPGAGSDRPLFECRRAAHPGGCGSDERPRPPRGERGGGRGGQPHAVSDQRYRHRFAVFGRFKRYCSKCPMTERHWRVIIISVNRLFRGGETVVTL